MALLCGHQAKRVLGSMAWRIVAVAGTLASLGFVAGIVRVFTNRPDPAMGVWDAAHRPHYLAPSPSPRILFALLAVGAICLAAAPLLRGQVRRGRRRWHVGLFAGVTVAVTMVGAGMYVYRHPPDHRACYDVWNQTTGQHSTLCRSEPDKLFGKTAGRYLIGSAGALTLLTLVSLPLLAYTDRRRPTPS